MVSTLWYGPDRGRATVSDRINFQETSVILDGAYMHETKVKGRHNDGRVHHPQGGLVTANDTGFEGADYTLAGKVLNPKDNEQTLLTLKSFSIRPATTAELPFGAYGVKLDRLGGVFDLTPNSERGLKFIDFDIGKSEDDPSAIAFVISLGFVGDPGSSYPYRW